MPIFPQSAIEATPLTCLPMLPSPSIHHPSILYVLAFRAYDHNCMDGVGTGKPLAYKGHGRPPANKCRQIERSRGPLLTAHLSAMYKCRIEQRPEWHTRCQLGRGVGGWVRRNELDLFCSITVNLL